jgi:hypothetical protein
MDPFLTLLLWLVALAIWLVTFLAVLKLFTIARLLKDIRDALWSVNPPARATAEPPTTDTPPEKLSILQRLGGRT